MRKVLMATYLGSAAMLAVGSASANDELIKMSQNPKDWVMPAGDYANTRYSKLNQINAQNVGKLQVAWTFSTGVLRGHEGGPLIIGNVMYVHTPFPNKVYALDLSNENKIIWKYEPKQDPNVIPVMCCDTVNRGLSYGDGKIILHQADTTLVALDAKTGQVAWSVKNGDPTKGETGTSAPLVVKDKVLIGISGGEFGVQAHMTAYDLKTGKLAWRGYSGGPDDQILVDAEKTTVYDFYQYFYNVDDRDVVIRLEHRAVGLERAEAVLGVEQTSHRHDRGLGVPVERPRVAGLPPLVPVRMHEKLAPERNAILEILGIRVRDRAHRRRHAPRALAGGAARAHAYPAAPGQG